MNERTHPYPFIEELIRTIAERTGHSSSDELGYKSEERVQKALKALFGDWNDLHDGRENKRIFGVYKLFVMANMKKDNPEMSATQVVKNYFNEDQIKELSKAQGVEERSFIMRYAEKLSSDLDGCLHPDGYEILVSMYQGVPELPFFYEVEVLAPWFKRQANFVGAITAYLEKKSKKPCDEID